MAKLNKVICDKCKQELTKDYVKFTLTMPTKNGNGYMIYPQVGRIDLCDNCFKDFKNNFLKRRGDNLLVK